MYYINIKKFYMRGKNDMDKLKKAIVYILIILLIIAIGVETHYMLTNRQQSLSTIYELENYIAKLEDNIINLSSVIQNNITNENINNNETANESKENETIINSQIDNENTYKIEELRNIYNIISDEDTELVKAQKIAKEVMNAANQKDWYYLAKLIGTDADNFIKYGIYNYNIDVNNCEYIEDFDEYVFWEEYDWDKSKLNSIKDVGLGKMLIVKFEEGGGIVIDPFCTGV